MKNGVAVAIRESPTEQVQPGVDGPPHAFGARSWKFQFPSESSLGLPPFCPLGQGQERATRKGAAPLVDRRTWPPRSPLRRPLAARGYHRRAAFVSSWRAERHHSIDRYSPFRARQAWYLSRRCRPFRNPSSCLCFAVRRWRAGCCTTGCLPRAGEEKSVS